MNAGASMSRKIAGIRTRYFTGSFLLRRSMSSTGKKKDEIDIGGT